MGFVKLHIENGIATVALAKGKVNALNEPLVEEIHATFKDVQSDRAVKAAILTGQGKFFCFGFDIPEFMSYSKEDFMRYLAKVVDLYAYLFMYPKPVVAALNGHATAGGCVLAIVCDYRIMARGKARIGLTELNLGSTVTNSAIAMLKYSIGGARAEKLLYTGALLSAEEAYDLGLVSEVMDYESIAKEALRVAQNFAGKEANAFRSTKLRLRESVSKEMERLRQSSIQEFADCWYLEETRKNLEKVRIFT